MHPLASDHGISLLSHPSTGYGIKTPLSDTLTLVFGIESNKDKPIVDLSLVRVDLENDHERTIFFDTFYSKTKNAIVEVNWFLSEEIGATSTSQNDRVRVAVSGGGKFDINLTIE